MRRIAIHLSYIAVPMLAIVAFLFVHRQMNGIAPAPPTAVPSTNTEPPPPTTTEQQPTVLAPEDSVDSGPPTSIQDTTWSEVTVLPSSYDGALPRNTVQPTIRTAKSSELKATPNDSW